MAYLHQTLKQTLVAFGSKPVNVSHITLFEPNIPAPLGLQIGNQCFRYLPVILHHILSDIFIRCCDTLFCRFTQRAFQGFQCCRYAAAEAMKLFHLRIVDAKQLQFIFQP
ncbi:hypothetical protein D3C76_1320900 [compost metagenome]